MLWTSKLKSLILSMENLLYNYKFYLPFKTKTSTLNCKRVMIKFPLETFLHSLTIFIWILTLDVFMYFDSFFHMQTFELLCFHNLASKKNKVEELYTGLSFYVPLMLPFGSSMTDCQETPGKLWKPTVKFLAGF